MNYNLFELKERIWRQAMNIRNVFVYGEYHFPKMITFETRTICNRACPYCPNSVEPLPLNTMTDETYEIMCQRVKEINFRGKIVLSSFSEPLLDARIMWLIRRMKEVNPKTQVCIFTNGDMLNSTIVKGLKASGAEYIAIARHPPFTRAWDEKIAKLCEQFPEFIQFRGTLLGKPWLYNFGGYVPNMPNARSWSYCDSIRWNVTIHYNGDFPLCANLPTRKPIFGNLVKESFLSIWRKPEFVAMRKQTQTGNPTFPTCQKCFDRTSNPIDLTKYPDYTKE